MNSAEGPQTYLGLGKCGDDVMMPSAADEAGRLRALHALHVLDTIPELEYDDINLLTAAVCEAPMASVSLVDESRQWFKARVGFEASETKRASSFCDYAILGDDLTQVCDAVLDERFRGNPLVVGPPYIRFYAGMPLTTPEGYNVGTLCVMDRVPRELNATQQQAMRVLARQVVAQLVVRRRNAELKASLDAHTRIEAELRASEVRFRAFMNHSPALAFMKDEDGRIVYANQLMLDQFGLTEEQCLGRTDFDLWSEDVARKLRVTDREILDTGRTQILYETVPTPDGETYHWQSFKFRFCDSDGKRFLVGMAVDRTAEKKAEEALRRSEERFRGIVDRLSEGIMVVDAATQRFVEANATLLSMLGYIACEFQQLTPPDIVARESPENLAQIIEHIYDELAKHGRCDLGRRYFRRKDGTVVVVDVRISLVPNGGTPLHALIIRDLTTEIEAENRLMAYQTQLEKINAGLRHSATTDGLTGVRNRAAFNDKLGEEYERCVRHGRPLSLVMLDVDHFKLFNDSYGHPAGDHVLKIVATTLSETVRVLDTVARYGGEEFAVILPETDYAGAMVLAERCRRAIAGVAWDRRIVTVSVGVATLTDRTTVADLVREADEALYCSKKAGRNRVNHGSNAISFAATMRM